MVHFFVSFQRHRDNFKLLAGENIRLISFHLYKSYLILISPDQVIPATEKLDFKLGDMYRTRCISCPAIA